MSGTTEKMKELTLMLLYLSSWKEGPKDMPYYRSWKGYDFDILNMLEEEGLIYGSHKAKSVAIDESGVERAKALLREYGITDSSGSNND